MTLIRGWRKQNRDALTFQSKRSVTSVLNTALEALEAANSWTPNRVFKIAYKLACWAVNSAKKYTDKRLAEGVTAASPARFFVETDGYQIIDANEDAGLFMTDLRYKYPSSLLDDPAWLTYGDSVPAEVTTSEGLWQHTFYIRIKYNVFTGTSKIRVRLRMRVFRSSTGITDDLIGESIVRFPESFIFLDDYDGGWENIAASIDYESIDGDTFIPSIVVEGLSGGAEVQIYGYWCAHRVGSL